MVMAMDMLMAGVDTTSRPFIGPIAVHGPKSREQEKLRSRVLGFCHKKILNLDENALKICIF
ncbi:hypothetical protein DOY81_011698 [Sarcophaga bullata]|nr:hypothetical protein DOY81_011698 [Sarcophaga bullata]